MAQVNETPEIASIANGATSSFPIPFTFATAADIRVWVVSAAGVRTLQTPGVDYTVTGANVVFLPGHLPPANSRVERIRREAADQPEAFGDDATFRPAANEDAFDKGVRLVQEARALGARSLQTPVGETGPVLVPAANRANTLMIWDEDGIDLRTDRTLIAFDADVAAAMAAANTATAAIGIVTGARDVTVAARDATLQAILDAPNLVTNKLDKSSNLSDVANAASARANIGAANSNIYRDSGSAKIMRATSDGFGIDAFPVCALHVGGTSPASDSLIAGGRTLTGARAIYSHTFSAANDFTTTLSGGDGEHAFNDFDARSILRGNTYNHYAGYQSHLTASDGGVCRDYWGYVFSGVVTGGGSAITRAKGLFIANVLGNVGTQMGAYFADLTAGLADNFAIYMDGATKSRFNRFGVQYDNPSGLADFNALGSNNSSLVFRRGGTFQASYGTVGSNGAVMTGSAVDDMVTRMQGTAWHVSTDSGGSSSLTLLANGVAKFPRIATTANAANLYADASAGNSLLVSSSSRTGKTDFDPLNADAALATALRLEPTWFRSLSSFDRAADRHLGLIAEDVAEVCAELAHWTTAPDGQRIPSGVQYERVAVLGLGAIANLDRRLRALEARAA